MADFEITQQDWEQLAQRVANLEAALAQKRASTEIAVADDRGKQLAKAKRGHRLPEGWIPSSESVEKMRKELMVDSATLVYEHRKFSDYWLSVPGQKGVKLDWDRTWCNWMRTASERGSLRGSNSRPNDEKIRDLMEMDIHAEGE